MRWCVYGGVPRWRGADVRPYLSPPPDRDSPQVLMRHARRVMGGEWWWFPGSGVAVDARQRRRWGLPIRRSATAESLYLTL